MSRNAWLLLLPTVALFAGCDSSTEPKAECIATVYTIGSVVDGTLASDDCRYLETNQYADYYEIIKTTAGDLSVTLESGTRRMGVAIMDETGLIVDERFASPGVSVSASGNDLPPGTYYAIVTAFNGGETGSYTMSSSTTEPGDPAPFFGCPTSQPYTIGSSVNGTLSNTGCFSDLGQNFNLYSFTLVATRTITITLEAGQTSDPFIYLFDEDGSVRATRDLNEEGLPEQLLVILPPGTYYIGASDYRYGAANAYTLRSQ